MGMGGLKKLLFFINFLRNFLYFGSQKKIKTRAKMSKKNKKMTPEELKAIEEKQMFSAKVWALQNKLGKDKTLQNPKI